MLSDSVVEVIGFDSSSEEKRLFSSSGNQTMDVITKTNETQTAEMTSTGMQAIPKNVADTDINETSYNVDRLLRFLKRILSPLEEELKDSASMGNDELNKNQMEESARDFDFVTEPGKAVKFSYSQIPIQPETFEDKIISKLSWNSRGMQLAVAFSKSTHKGWCNHEMSVCLYNTSQSKFEKCPPSRTLKTNSCITCIEFHPYVPSILAGGFHCGEVAVWDLTGDQEVLLTKIKGEKDMEFHTDTVTHLTWKEDRNGVKLVTAARDGKIITWRVTVGNLTFKAKERFLIAEKPITSADSVRCLEVNSVGFWPGKESEFVVAASNKVLHCSSTSAKLVSSLPGYKDPVFINYESHEGIVTSLSCLPLTDVFASCGIDREIRIYQSEMVAPLYVINTNYSVMGIQWTNSMRLASWGFSSAIECHKINLDSKILISTISHEVDGNVSAVAFNLKKRGKVAVGTKAGVLLLNDFVL